MAPDTTLKVTATKFGGLSTVIILKTAAAAANPALKKLHFGTTTNGVTVKADAANNITAAAADGTTLWHAPAPQMWDSTPSTTSPVQAQARSAPRTAKAAAKSSRLSRSSAADSGSSPHAESTADGPGTGARVAVMPVQTDATGINLSTDQDILSKGTGPWFIDPAWIADSRGVNLWNWVQSAHPDENNDNRQGDADSDHPGIGTCGTSYPNGGSCSTQSTYHTYYRFDLSGLGGAVINSATLNLQEYVSADWSCDTTYGIDAYRTDSVANGTTWSNEPTWRESQGTDNVGGSGATGSACHDNVPFQFNVTGAVSSQAGGSVTFGLRADDESNPYAFKRLTYQPSLSIQYDRYPAVPTGLHTGPITPRTLSNPDIESCGNGPVSSYGWITSDSVQLQSTLTSPGPNVLNEWVNIWDNTNGGKQVTTGWSGTVPSGGTASYQLPAKSLQNGHVYGWEAFANDGILFSPKTGVCHFSVDLSAPTLTVRPTIDVTTGQLPPSGNGQTTNVPVGGTGYLPVTADDPAPGAGLVSSGLAYLRWTYDPHPAANVGWVTPNNSKWVTPAGLMVSPKHWGTNVVYIQAEDNAGNISQPYPYSFYVPWTPSPLAYGDVSGDGHPDILAADPNTGDLLDYGQGITFTAPRTGVPTAGGSTLPGLQVAAPAANAPDSGHTWKDYHLTHRGSVSPQNQLDDLFAHIDPTPSAPAGGDALWNLTNSTQTPGTFYGGASSASQLFRPTCANTTANPHPECLDYGSVDSWSTVSQITPIGSSNAKLTPTDKPGDATGVLAVEKGNLWYYPAGNGAAANSSGNLTFFGQPVELAKGGWDNFDLMIPGDTLSTGQPALWVRARNNATGVTAGDILQYALTFDSTGFVVTGITQKPATPIDTNITTQNWPVVGAVGDLTGDNIPDLWGTGPTGQITTWAGTATDPTNKTKLTGFTHRTNQWLLNPNTKANDTTGNSSGNPVTPVGGTTAWSPDAPAGTAVTGSAALTGTGILAATGPALNTTTSYSVSAWAKLDNKNTWQTFVSQAGTTMGNFYLQYNKTLDAWTFLTTASDKAGAAQYIAHSDPKTLPVTPGQWTHLTGTYDLSYDSNNIATGTVTLYVNGQFAGSAGVSNPTANTWAATGPLTIGGVQTTGGAVNNQTTGHIADVRVYPYTLTKDQVTTIYNNE
ncbi:hypothetical protein P3T29_004390 [Kitasatospora sp. MAP5-34]|nr:hypothetical protein [Kitasatospora sp. MAP5-34]